MNKNGKGERSFPSCMWEEKGIMEGMEHIKHITLPRLVVKKDDGNDKGKGEGNKKKAPKYFQLLHESTPLMKWGITMRKYREKKTKPRNPCLYAA